MTDYYLTDARSDAPRRTRCAISDPYCPEPRAPGSRYCEDHDRERIDPRSVTRH